MNRDKTKPDYITPSERIETGRRNPNDYSEFMGKLNRRRNPGPPTIMGNGDNPFLSFANLIILISVIGLVILAIKGY